MGLLNTYGSGNRVILNDKTVTYSRSRIYGEWSYASGTSIITLHSVWEYHRYCSKSYMYVGMDRATAQSCANAMISKYTRSVKVSDWNSGEFVDIDGGTICMAEITIQKRAGHMYDVVVNVREDDAKNRVANWTPSSLFTTENQRDYDEGT